MTEGRILVRRAGTGDAWTAPETSAYDNEAHLQKLLVADPSRVPGVTDDAFAVAELPTASGPVDVCIVGADGSLTVVECKLESNSERRRMVIGQVLDYAAAISSAAFEALSDAWARRGGGELTQLLEPEGLEALKNNVRRGSISMCLAVDAIDDELRRLVEHLNLITTDAVKVTAVQLAYARHQDVEILIPSTFGGEIAYSKARSSSNGAPSSWTIPSFLEAIRSTDERALAEWYIAKTHETPDEGAHARLWLGAAPRGGVFLYPYGHRYAPLQLKVDRDGHLLLFGNWRQWPQIAGHEAFAGLATLFGQDHQGTSRNVRADQVDREQVWRAMQHVAREVTR